MSDSMLVADLGGTHARFAIAKRVEERLSIEGRETFLVSDFATIADASQAYIAQLGQTPCRACIAIAAPIFGAEDEVVCTNSHWRFYANDLCQTLGLSELNVINDFAAMAASIDVLSAEAFAEIRPGTPDTSAPTLIQGPGTGFGQALIVPFKRGYGIVSTQGGHVAFAPQNEAELAVKHFIERDHPRVTVEKLLSGAGLVHIYQTLCSLEGGGPEFNHPAGIMKAANNGNSELATKSLDMFCSVLGSVAGDGVLATGARGRVVLCGGILPRIRRDVLASSFSKAFLAKGPSQAYVSSVPVSLIIAEDAGLYGAAAYAADIAQR